MSAVMPANGAGTRTSAVSPTSYFSLSATSLIASSLVNCHAAYPTPETQRYVAERALRPRASVTSATARIVPACVGRYVMLPSPFPSVVVRSVVSRVSFGSLL